VHQPGIDMPLYFYMRTERPSMFEAFAKDAPGTSSASGFFFQPACCDIS
jgi:hypothetical protein